METLEAFLGMEMTLNQFCSCTGPLALDLEETPSEKIDETVRIVIFHTISLILDVDPFFDR